MSQKEESYYTLSWACELDGTPLLVTGGSNGIIRVINCGTEKMHKVCKLYIFSYFCY
jgi:polycomb protein EED